MITFLFSQIIIDLSDYDLIGQELVFTLQY